MEQLRIPGNGSGCATSVRTFMKCRTCREALGSALYLITILPPSILRFQIF
jgi:hypothetical protein